MKISTKYLINKQAILLIVFLAVTLFFNRFAADDYRIIKELEDNSFSTLYQYLYFSWHGRWSSNFLLLLFLQFKSTPYFLFIYGLLSFGVAVVAFRMLVNVLNNRYNLFHNNLNPFTIALIALGVFFYCTVSPNQSWFWYTSSVVYFWSVIALIFGLAVYLKEKKSLLDYLLLIVSLIFIGGSNEPLSILLIITVLLYWLKTRVNTSLILMVVVIEFIAFAINYFSKGTIHRNSITPSLSIKELLLYSSYGSFKFLFFEIYKTFLPALFFAVPFYWLGKKSTLTPTNFNFWKELIRSLFIVVALVFLNELFVVYALGGLSPERAMITSSIGITFIIIRFLYLAGASHINKAFHLKYLLFINIAALMIINVLYFNIHQNFANALDNRISTIKSNKNSKMIILESLPNSGYLYNDEIHSESSYFINQHLKIAFDVKGEIILKN